MQDLFYLDVCHEEPDETVICVCGDLDIATTPALATCLSNLLDGDTPCRALVVDLSAASFVDVGGANLLLDAHQRLTKRSAAMDLRGCSAQLVRLLHVIRILEVVDVVPVQRTCSTVVGEPLGNRARRSPQDPILPQPGHHPRQGRSDPHPRRLIKRQYKGLTAANSLVPGLVRLSARRVSDGSKRRVPRVTLSAANALRHGSPKLAGA
jgi:anti-anti-sigma factor